MSPEASLEQRCASLRDLASKDPLTGVANRAEFDRLLDLFVDAHFQNRLPCALIVCDIDHFKNVNDQHGHQAGDEVIKSVAGLLANRCQPGDVVARYGGEEFVLLCVDCSNAAAATRAELIRREVADASQPALGTGQVTASFGVTELQPGDTPETMFRRADRALLQAKEMGRNLVVQLGAGMKSEERRGFRWRWPWWSGRAKPSRLIETQLVTCVPVELAVEKLRGFVADHDAKVTSVGSDQVCLTIEGNQAPHMPRHGDRSVPFLIEIKFNAGQSDGEYVPGRPAVATAKTRLSVVIRPKRDRDRRQEQAAQRARQVLASLKSYLMATE
jgi:diguanylate cyclase (GGDEF)-like protein